MEITSIWILYFMIYAFMGWILETGFAMYIEKKFVNRGFLKGPFVPLYGFAGVLIIMTSNLLENPMKNKIAFIIVQICISILIVTLLELITGFILEVLFKNKWWDYSHLKYNFKGYICVQFSLIWGVLAYVLIEVVHPHVERGINYLNEAVHVSVASVFVIYFVIDTILSVYDVIDLRNVIVNQASIPFEKYKNKIIGYKRIFKAFPSLLSLNVNVINRDVRGILNEGMEKIKGQIKNRFK